MKPRPLVLAFLGVLLGGSNCNEMDLFKTGHTCQDDADCAPLGVCLLGKCQDPRAQNLGKVDLEVTPAGGSGLRQQAFTGRDTTRSTREELVLRPTWDTPVQVCHACDYSDRDPISGDLSLTGPEHIPGHQQVETLAVDATGMGHVGLLEDTPYAPLLFPAAPEAPILRGRQVFASAALTTGVLRIEMPDPDDVYDLRGSVLADGLATAPDPVDGLRVWASQEDSRLVRDVLTGDDGRFSLRIPRDHASGITLHIAPADAAAPWPDVTVSGLNLDASRDLPPISLGVTHVVRVRGTVTGPAGQVIPGATVKLEGPAGAGVVRVSAAADESGRYALEVPPGTYARAVVPPLGLGAALKQEEGIQVGAPGPGQEPPTMDVALSTPARLCGQVLDQGGGTVGNASVRAQRVGNASGSAGPASDAAVDLRVNAAEDGRYCVDLDPGQYLLTGTPPVGTRLPRRTDLLNVGLDASPHDLRLPPAAFITGTVRAPDGSALSRARVRAYSPVLSTSQGALELGEAFTADDGTFTMPVPDLASLGQH